MRTLAVACVFGLALSVAAQTAEKKPDAKTSEVATHKQLRVIDVKGTDGALKLQTLALDGEGRILGLVGQSRYFNAPAKGVVSEVHVIDPAGKTVATWKVNFHAHSINAGPDGTVFVAGDGKVAKFDSAGKQLAEIQLPHIAELLKDDGSRRKAAEAQVKQQKDSFENTLKQLKDRLAAIEKKKEDDRSEQEKRQLKQLAQSIKSYEQSRQYYDNITVESVINQQTSRLRIINGIAVGAKELYIVCGETKGYGYAIWRMDHAFKNAQQVKSGVRGCCGQMDVQVSGDDFVLAENCEHRFARYDRDGKFLVAGGEKGRESEGKCFGGCCNPMNVRVQGGDIYTAESEGIVKRFNAKGEFVALVGKAELQGGCKNVAVAVSKTGDQVYFCDQPGSRVIVLAKK